jgi:hypothetical protein
MSMYFDCPALSSEYPSSGLIKYNVNGEFENAVEPPVFNAPLLHVFSTAFTVESKAACNFVPW